ncbi:MAG: hypothetical protein RJA36_1939 [Pseudomonadota bacterium]|jgi:hypothetical protein
MKLSLTSTGLAQIEAELAGFSQRRLNAALATALTRVAVAAKAAEVREMVDSFDRPTPYTLDAVYTKPATAQRLESEVGIKDQGARPQSRYLRWQIEGGPRRWTGFERSLIRGGAMPDSMRAVPGRFARLDAYGNVSRGQMTQILSQLRIDTGRAGSTRALPTVLSTDSAKDKARKLKTIRGAQRRAGGQFVAFPNGRGKLPAGIYLVRDTAWGRAAPKPIFIFVSSAVYEQRLDFAFVAELQGKRLGQELELALQQSVARSVARLAARS